jgi:hypothetical protein
MGQELRFPCFIIVDGTKGAVNLPLLWGCQQDQGPIEYGIFVLRSRLEAKEVIGRLKRYYRVHREGYHPTRLGVREIGSDEELLAATAGTDPCPTVALVQFTYDRSQDTWRAEGGHLSLVGVPAGAGLN